MKINLTGHAVKRFRQRINPNASVDEILDTLDSARQLSRKKTRSFMEKRAKPVERNTALFRSGDALFIVRRTRTGVAVVTCMRWSNAKARV